MLRFLWLFACLVLWGPAANAQVVNGDFETSDLTGWSDTSNSGNGFVITESDIGFRFPSPTHALYLEIGGLAGWFGGYGRVESASFEVKTDTLTWLSRVNDSDAFLEFTIFDDQGDEVLSTNPGDSIGAFASQSMSLLDVCGEDVTVEVSVTSFGFSSAWATVDDIALGTNPCPGYVLDNDGDGFCSSGQDLNGDGDCNDAGEASSGSDCDDTNPAVNSGAVEVCDGIDNNCINGVDEFGATGGSVYYTDFDQDGFGNVLDPGFTYCTPPGIFYVTNNDDCDDTDAQINPNGAETCNGEDDNCNGLIDEGQGPNDYFVDGDEDGFGDDGAVAVSFVRIRVSGTA